MNIYYFSGIRLPSRSPLSVHVMKMAQAFRKAGHRVNVFARSAWNARASDILKIYNIDVPFDIELSAHTSFPILLQHRMKLLRGGGMHGPDLIYGHDVLALAFHASLARSVIFEVSRLPVIPSRRMAFTKLIRSDNLKGIIAHSDVLKKELLQHYPELSAEEIFVAHDGADLLHSIQGDLKSGRTLKGNHKFNVGYAGSLTPGKGLDLIARIAKIRPDYGFHILGGESDRVMALNQKNIFSNVYFYGHRDHGEVFSFLRSFDVCVAPYQNRALVKTAKNTARWISPMKIFEYMAAKRPIISSNLPGVNNILRHEHDALLLPPFDENKWALALDLLKNDKQFAQTLSDNAYETLSAKYTWDKRMHAIMEFCGLEVAEDTFSLRAIK